MFRRELGIVLEPRALLALHVVEELDRAVHDEDADCIDREQPQRPSPGQCLQCCDVRDDKDPVKQGRRHVEGIPRPQILQEPMADLLEIASPERCNLRQGVWRPVTALVAGPVFEIVHFFLPTDV